MLTPNDGADLTSEGRFQLLKPAQQVLALDLTDDEHVNVAAHVVIPAGVGPEHERVTNAGLTLECRTQLRNEADGSCVEVAKRLVHGIRRIHSPHSQRAYPPALDESLSQQLLESKLNRARAALDSPNQIARMELLARRTREQREQASLSRGTLD